MPASPTDSTSSATRDRSATASEAVAAEAGLSPDATTSAAPSAPATGSTKSKAADPTCPTCRGALERYAGEAAHKLGSFWCHACGVRQRLPASGATEESTAPARTSGTPAAR